MNGMLFCFTIHPIYIYSTKRTGWFLLSWTYWRFRIVKSQSRIFKIYKIKVSIGISTFR